MRYYDLFFYFAIFIGALNCSTLWAQKSGTNVNLPEKVETLLELKKEINNLNFREQYFAIQLYYGNNTAAYRILNEFKIKFPQMEAEISFETPNYKVRVGRFKNKNRASRQLEIIRREYPSAFLLEPNNL